MRYLLDTNTCIRYLNGRSRSVRLRLEQLDPSDIAVCSVVQGELFYGAARSANPVRSQEIQDDFLGQFISLPFDDGAAHIYGRIRAELTVQGKLIGPYDLQIAAIALGSDLTLVTHNTREFGRIRGLRLDDWEIGERIADL